MPPTATHMPDKVSSSVARDTAPSGGGRCAGCSARAFVGVIAAVLLAACAPREHGAGGAPVGSPESRSAAEMSTVAVERHSGGGPTPSGSAVAAQTFSAWLKVEIAGGTTWINLERVESIRRLPRNIPAGSLPILVVEYGSGRKAELAFDSVADLERALADLESGLRRVGR